jgi:hypothetical protein
MAKREDCFATLEGRTADELLADWRWLIGPEAYEVLRVTAFGDLFLRDAKGRVHLLDTAWGAITLVGTTELEWVQRLDDRHQRREWLFPFVVESLHRTGVFLKPGQCYSWKHPPHLGGVMEVDNAEPRDVLVHVSMLGQIHRQSVGLPEGTPVRRFVDGSAPGPAQD